MARRLHELGAGTLTISSNDGIWRITSGASLVATGELSPHNTVSPASYIAQDGNFCLSVRNTKVDAQYWTADDVGLRPGDCTGTS